MTSVHVTGGSGFLGGHVIPRLLEGGYEVTALARSERAVKIVASLGARPIIGNLDDPNSIFAAFRASGSSFLVNLASLGFGHAGTIVNAAEAIGLQRSIFVSTTALYTRLNATSKSIRIAAEETIRQSSLEWTILRPTMIYGTQRDRNMARLLRFISRSPLVPLPGGGRRLQQPVHVDDLAAAIVSAAQRPISIQRAYDIAGPTPLALRDVVDEAAEAVGRRPLLVPLPLRATIAIARILERTGRGPVRAEQIERLAEDKAFDITPAVRDLAYAPRPFFEGINQEAKLMR
jgi:uncharacterized protein YbjT (DUF2867 family)